MTVLDTIRACDTQRLPRRWLFWPPPTRRSGGAAPRVQHEARKPMMLASHAPGFVTHVRGGVLNPLRGTRWSWEVQWVGLSIAPLCCDAMMQASRGVMGAPNGIPMTPTTYACVCAAGRLHQQSLPEGSRLSAHTHTDGRQGALVRGGQTRTRQSLPKGIPVIHLLAQLLPAGCPKAEPSPKGSRIFRPRTALGRSRIHMQRKAASLRPRCR